MRASNDQIRVVIADDHPIFRKGLLQVIELEPDLVIVGEAADGQTALEQIKTLKPDVAVLDIDMRLWGKLFALKAYSLFVANNTE